LLCGAQGIAEGGSQLSGNNLFYQMNSALAHANSLFGSLEFSGPACGNEECNPLEVLRELMAGVADF
jgi:hypothetical protein